MSLTLADLGWNDAFEVEFQPFYKKAWKPARLIRDNKITYGALLDGGEELEVVMSGDVYHRAKNDAALPAVGDWVAIDVGSDQDEPMIRERLSRQTCFSRKAPGKTSAEQVIAANADVVIVVTDADTDFNLRRMERYIALTARSGSKLVVLVNKSDLFPTEQNEGAAAAIRELSAEVDVHITTAVNAEGVEVIRTYLHKGVTGTLVGSSGVGKSSLVNQLLGGEEWQITAEVNEVSGKGRHTTTARELMVLRGGGILIDNPGIREVHMWTDESTLREQFEDIEELAMRCKFHDCKHGNDKGCAIREAVQSGELAVGRFESFLKLDEEIAKLSERRKRGQMNVERRAKRDHRIKARNLGDRIDLDRDLDPDRGNRI
ncbi:MAG: ribosome small subunit-dependent GTPase A [Verrucomicrobiales bacterium]|nr:ribosome small subunit-dependent GTPase A [Verrucomicrobiales bacterium]